MFRLPRERERNKTGRSRISSPKQRKGQPRLLDQVRQSLQARHYSEGTVDTYVRWIRRFILFHGKRYPREMAEWEINTFLTHLATEAKVAPSTQNQALSALLFLYRHVLRQEVGQLGQIVRARKSRHLPVVLTRDEVRSVLDQLNGSKRLVATLLYGSGLRLIECLRLRVQDLDFEQHEISVRNNKERQGRVTMLPMSLKQPLQDHLQRVRAMHRRDVADGWGRVELPRALARKYVDAAADWRWQWVFPQANRWKNAQTGQQGRHHMGPSIIQKAVTAAVKVYGARWIACSVTV